MMLCPYLLQDLIWSRGLTAVLIQQTAGRSRATLQPCNIQVLRYARGTLIG